MKLARVLLNSLHATIASADLLAKISMFMKLRAAPAVSALLTIFLSQFSACTTVLILSHFLGIIWHGQHQPLAESFITILHVLFTGIFDIANIKAT